MLTNITMNTLFAAADTNLLVKEEIKFSETVIQEQRLEAELDKGTGDANETSGSGRTGGAEQSLAQNDEAEVRKFAMSFQCPKCPKCFGNRKLARYHLRKSHSGTQIRSESCLICSRSFKYKSFLSIHMNNHHEKICPICKTVVSGSEALKKHAESQHIGKVEYVCPICFKMSIDSASYEDHVSSHNGRRRYECEDCSKYYASPEGLERHRQTHARIIKNKLRIHYNCTICWRAYRSERKLRVHMKTHTGARPFKCNQCPEKFLNRQSLQAHWKTHVNLSRQIKERKYKCSFCLKSYSHRQSLKNHIQTHTEAQLFKCDACPKEYTSRQALFVHRQSHMPKCTKVKCSLCSKVFKKSGYLQIHMNYHNGSRPYKCDQCSGSFASSSSLARHRKIHLNEHHRLKCSICSKTLSSLPNLRFHMNIHTGMRPYQCDQCPNNYASSKALQNHRKSHEEGDYKCSYCPKTYAEKYRLRNHINTHTGARPFQCDLCSKAFPNARYMARHRQSHSQGDKLEFKCDICSEIFTNKGSLTRHSNRLHFKTHTEVRPFKCDECPKDYTTIQALGVHRQSHVPEYSNVKCTVCSKVIKNSRDLHFHMNIHSGSRPYKCNQCSRSYTSPSGLAHHRQVHLTKGIRLKCSICSKSLSSLLTLRSHMNIHTDLRPYQCDQCPNNYASSNALHIHRKSHKDKNYKCSYCPKTFAYKYLLHRHINTHTGAQPFKCSQCPKTFAHKYLLRRHINRHTGARPFKCSQCPKDYTSRNTLNEHLKTHVIKPGERKSLQDEGKDGELYKVPDIQTALVNYKCKECDKEFVSERNLSFHSRLHEKELTPE